MPSVLDLVDKNSDEIYDHAKEVDLKGRGDMTTGEMKAALADETLPEKAKWVLQSSTSKDDLVDFANEIGVDSDGRKKEIQKLLLENFLSSNQRGDLSIEDRTHFDDMSVRKEEISKMAAQAAERTIHNGYPYVVIESFRDKDYNQPLCIQRKYMGHDADEIVVFETQVSTIHLPNTNVDKNPPRP